MSKKKDYKNNLEFKGQKLKQEFKNFQSNYLIIYSSQAT